MYFPSRLKTHHGHPLVWFCLTTDSSGATPFSWTHQERVMFNSVSKRLVLPVLAEDSSCNLPVIVTQVHKAVKHAKQEPTHYLRINIAFCSGLTEELKTGRFTLQCEQWNSVPCHLFLPSKLWIPNLRKGGWSPAQWSCISVLLFIPGLFQESACF